MASIDTLVDDFSALLSEADALLKKASQETGEQARDLQTEIEAKLQTARLKLQDMEGQATESAKAVKQATETYVQQNPWQAVGIAAAVGFVAGIMLTRK